MWFYLSSWEARFCSGLVLWVPSPLHGGVSRQGGGPARPGLADCMGHGEGGSADRGALQAGTFTQSFQ